MIEPLLAQLLIPSTPIPTGTPFSERESLVHRALLIANGYQATAIGYRRAAVSDEATLRTAAFQLLAREPIEEHLVLFEHGVADRTASVRAFAAFGLDQLRPGRGLAILHELAARPLEFGDYAPLIAAALLACRGDPSGFPTVERALNELGEPRAVVARLWPFARLGVVGVWARYDQALATDDLTVREQVLAQLRELGEVDPLGAVAAAPVLARFVARLADDDPWKPSASALLRAVTGAP